MLRGKYRKMCGFMSSTLSNVLENLSERFHFDKCRDLKS